MSVSIKATKLKITGTGPVHPQSPRAVHSARNSRTPTRSAEVNWSCTGTAVAHLVFLLPCADPGFVAPLVQHHRHHQQGKYCPPPKKKKKYALSGGQTSPLPLSYSTPHPLFSTSLGYCSEKHSHSECDLSKKVTEHRRKGILGIPASNIAGRLWR